MNQTLNFKAELNNLLAKIRHNNKVFNRDMITEAYWFALRMHEGQKRYSGEPYFIHPINVSSILADWGFSDEIIASALLHDVLEDTDFSEKEFIEKFGDKIYYLVNGITKLEKISEKTQKNDADFSENLQKIFAAASRDIRVIIIKLADNLHNMRTIEFMPKYKRGRYARESLEIYALIAHRLGIHDLKFELEDHGFRFAFPEESKKLENNVKKMLFKKTKTIEAMIRILKKDQKINAMNPLFEVNKKGLLVIRNKLRDKSKTIDEIEDTAVLSIIVNSVDDCYAMLGRIHQTFIPRPRKIKDFISLPRDDLYQSLHTTILGPKGERVKIYIRTKEMEEIRKKGIISLILGKNKQNNLLESYEKKIAWCSSIEGLGQNMKKEGFLEALKSDYLSQQIHVFSTGGKMIELPRGSTGLDFAYALGTSKGNKIKGVKVNQKLVPLWHELDSGDKIELMLGEKTLVDPTWLDFVKSNETKSKIKKALKELKRKTKEEDFIVNLRLKVSNKQGTLFKIVETISELGVQVHSIYSTHADPNPFCNFTLSIENKKTYDSLINRLSKIPEVLEINTLLGK